MKTSTLAERFIQIERRGAISSLTLNSKNGASALRLMINNDGQPQLASSGSYDSRLNSVYSVLSVVLFWEIA
jgi:hypothetical protein